MSNDHLLYFTTYNSNLSVTIFLSHLSHIIDDDQGCWIHLTSGKSIHVKESYDEATETIQRIADSRD